MPIFLKNKFVFIHIPKTGGTSVEEEFKSRGDNPLFFSSEYFVNSHSPQHSTYDELNSWGLIPNDFKIFAVIRHPYERFISEYNYRYDEFKEPLKDFTKRFCGWFRNEHDWDNHHLSCSDFLQNSKNVEILRFENLKEDFKKLTGFDLTKHEMKREKIITLQDLTDEIKERICSVWEKDFINYGYKN